MSPSLACTLVSNTDDTP